jgi:hypothetical protein
MMRISKGALMVPAQVLLGLVASSAALAQPTVRTIRLDQTVEARLTGADPQFEDRGRIHVYRIEATAAKRYVITLDSPDFDAYVWVARAVGPLTEKLGSDDDGGEDTNARLRFLAPATGSYFVVAQSLSADGLGAYTLTVTEAPTPALAVAEPIAIGETRAGRIDDASPRLEEPEDMPHRLYRLVVPAGKRIRVLMTSDDFDSYLVARRTGFTGADDISDDDSGGQTNARITLSAAGEYLIVARPLSADGIGDFSLSVTEAVDVPVTTRDIAIGGTAEGTISADDPELDEGPFFHEYEVAARAGDVLRITLRSEAFDAFLRWGRRVEGVFTELADDDDSGGNVDARLEITVDASGKYLIRVSPLGAGSTGAYVLQVERVAR